MRHLSIAIMAFVFACSAISLDVFGQWPGDTPGRGNGAGPGWGQGRGRGARAAAVADASSPDEVIGQPRGNGGRGQGRGYRGGRGPDVAAARDAQNVTQRPGKNAGKGRGPGAGACPECQAGVEAASTSAEDRGSGQRACCAGDKKSCGQETCGVGTCCTEQITARILALPKGNLSPADRDGLALMREEEKLAHDVYVTLHKTWKLPPFAHIPQAESRHMDAMKVLLDRYDIEDPIIDMTVGVFQNSQLQTLYDTLVAQGQGSIEESLKVGALIEELDIADLQKLSDGVQSDDLRVAYENLMLGSRNHLRAFSRQLAQRNVNYEAKHLSQEEFDRIAASAHERGGLSSP